MSKRLNNFFVRTEHVYEREDKQALRYSWLDWDLPFRNKEEFSNQRQNNPDTDQLEEM